MKPVDNYSTTIRVISTCALLLLFLPLWCYGQQVNLGLHLDPLLPIPVNAEQTPLNEDFHIAPRSLSYNAGIDARLAFEKWYMASGANFLNRKIGYGNTYRAGLWHRTYTYTRVSRTSLEFPLLVGARLHRHEARLKYEIFGVAGVALERQLNLDYSIVAGGHNSNATVPYHYSELVPVSAPNTSQSIIVGGNVHTILLKAGLISYGLELHYPLKHISHYYLNMQLENENVRVYEPRLPHLDFRLCYYFLNVANAHRVR